MRVSWKWFRSMYRGILFLLLFVLCCGGCAGVACGMEECAEKKESNGAGQLRCIAFYSSVNGVSSTIFRVTSSIQEHLGTDERILLSVYCLPSDLYESLDYKVKTAAALDMDVMIVSNMSGDLDEDNLEELQENIQNTVAHSDDILNRVQESAEAPVLSAAEPDLPDIPGTEPAEEPAGELSDENMNHNQRILDMYRAGKTDVDIAKELGLGVGEVKLVIGLFREEDL